MKLDIGISPTQIIGIATAIGGFALAGGGTLAMMVGAFPAEVGGVVGAVGAALTGIGGGLVFFARKWTAILKAQQAGGFGDEEEIIPEPVPEVGGANEPVIP